MADVVIDPYFPQVVGWVSVALLLYSRSLRERDPDLKVSEIKL